MTAGKEVYSHLMDLDLTLQDPVSMVKLHQFLTAIDTSSPALEALDRTVIDFHSRLLRLLEGIK